MVGNGMFDGELLASRVGGMLMIQRRETAACSHRNRFARRRQLHVWRSEVAEGGEHPREALLGRLRGAAVEAAGQLYDDHVARLLLVKFHRQPHAALHAGGLGSTAPGAGQ